MHIKTFCRFLLIVLVVAGYAAPNRIAVVPAAGRAALAQLAQAGVMEYARTGDFVFAAPSPALASLPSVVEVALDPGKAAYLVRTLRARSQWPGRVLWQEGSAVLMQLSRVEAEAVSRLGGELQQLPDKPHRMWLAPERSYPRCTDADTFIQRLIGRVSADSIRKQIQRLQDFRTRFSPAESCRAAEQYVFDYFTALGMDSVQLDTYQWEGITMRNVVGTLVGKRNPEQIAIICGHMDGTSDDPYNLAPGAEDNASGTVMALEAARIMVNEAFDGTVKFIAFTGEEQGLIGSFHYAEEMRGRNADILGVLNFDMIAWPGGQFGVAIYCDEPSYGLATLEGRMASLYTSLTHGILVASYGSDQLAFHEYGYQGTAGAEYGDFYPYYHTTEDTIGHLSMALAAEVAKMGIAGLATLALAPGPPDSFRLWDAGIGGTLEATWRASSAPDVAGYKLLWGAAAGAYTDSLAVGRITRRQISGLQNGTRYYSTVVALDSTGHESGPAPEQSAIPGAVPLAPHGIIALPSPFGMSLSWLRGIELDLAGYNVYRSTASGGGYAKVNPALVTDSVFGDSGLLSDTMYYYVITALDSSANESPRSAEVSGKPITLDHGILLVDETRDGTGQRGSPSDAQQDAFYHTLLSGTRYRDWDVATESVPLAGDVGPFSTIVWHADDYTQQRVHPAVPGLANYLEQGGRLWLVGWKPMLGLMGGGRYPFTFAAGGMPYDDLHLDGAGQCEAMNFTGAVGQSGYPGVSIDSTKLFASFAGKLPFADVLYPRDAETVLTFNSAAGDSFQGKPVGVRWLAGPGKAVCFGFPLYYTVDSEARVLARRVLDDLGEPYGIEEATKSQMEMTKAPPSVVRNVLFLPVSQFTLHYSLFDMAGRSVMSLRPGANDLRGLAPGVYFYRAETGGTTRTMKIAIVR
jgi:hypothetical protein